jgi:amino acid transporter
MSIYNLFFFIVSRLVTPFKFYYLLPFWFEKFRQFFYFLVNCICILVSFFRPLNFIYLFNLCVNCFYIIGFCIQLILLSLRKCFEENSNENDKGKIKKNNNWKWEKNTFWRTSCTLLILSIFFLLFLNVLFCLAHHNIDSFKFFICLFS